MNTETSPIRTGSAKQIAWATSIRATLLAEHDKDLESVARRGRTLSPALAAEVETLTDIEDARWWIDHRQMGGLLTIARQQMLQRVDALVASGLTEAEAMAQVDSQARR